MKMQTTYAIRIALLGAVLSPIFISEAYAGQVITSGAVSVGIQDEGALGFGGVGIARAGVGDGITPGCLCEGWGVSGNGISGWSANANGGTFNVTGDSFTSTATTAVSTVHLTSLPGLSIVQSYGLSASADLIQNTVTFTNTTGATIADVRYSRSMDWDIPPTTFSELVTVIRAGATALLFSNDNGFATPDPLVNPAEISSGTTNTDFVDSGPDDHGAFFTFGFGDLAAGASKTFNIFYGAAESQALALTALGLVNAEVYSLGQQNGDGTTGTPATFIFGFNGVGGTTIGGTVPEPATLALIGLGLAGMAGSRKRKFTAKAC